MWRVGDVSGVLRGWDLECERLRVCDDRSEATWRESSSLRYRSPAVLSGIEGETLAVVGWGVTSQSFQGGGVQTALSLPGE